MIDRLKKLFLDNPAFAIGAVVLAIMVILVIVFNLLGSGSNTAGEFVPADQPASIIYKNADYNIFPTAAPRQALNADVALFARSTISFYKNMTDKNRKNVVFILSAVPSRSEGTWELHGKYRDDKDSIVIKVTRLTNDRIHLSITNTSTNTNIDGSLASNSTRNQFIGSLPIVSGNFTIDYDSVSNSFSAATGQIPSKADGLKIKAIIAKGLGVNDIADSDLYFPVYRVASLRLSELK